MYLPKLNRYVPDANGLILMADIEAAAQKGHERGEIYEIALVGVNHPYEAEWKIRPSSYAGTKFQINAGATEFLRNQHGVGYFDDLEFAGLHWVVVAERLHDTIADLREGYPEVVLYSRGSDYDFQLLEHFLGQAGLTPPWHYRNLRDLRTLAAVFPQIPQKAGNHTALSDAYAQASHLEEIRSYLASLEVE